MCVLFCICRRLASCSRLPNSERKGSMIVVLRISIYALLHRGLELMHIHLNGPLLLVIRDPMKLKQIHLNV